MKYSKITEVLPVGFIGNIFIYTGDDLYMVAKIKVPLKSETKISTFIFQQLKTQFQESKDKEVKKVRKTGMLNEFVNNLENVFSDEDIEGVLTGFEAYDELK